MSIIDTIRNDARGAMLLADWLGNGGVPVPQEQAEFRSHKCVFGNDGKPCPKNVEPNWWEHVKSIIAEWIVGELEIKHKINLSVEYEDSLHMCSVCGCCLRLKVWPASSHIRKHVSHDQISKTPQYCWMRKELE